MIGGPPRAVGPAGSQHSVRRGAAPAMLRGPRAARSMRAQGIGDFYFVVFMYVSPICYIGLDADRLTLQNAIRISRCQHFIICLFSLENVFQTRYVMSEITYYIFRIDCSPLMLICSSIMDMGPRPRTKAQKLLGRGLRAHSFCSLGLGPGPRSITAEHMCIMGNQ